MDVPPPKKRAAGARPYPFGLPGLIGIAVVAVLVAVKSLGLATPPRPVLLAARWATIAIFIA
ncbi:MAG: hypothetical protein NTX99_04260, partial [Candidatus Aminicenantes bacterium]|nr:hypothetical protein [Candidatus Aminicenantes bacterium]